MQKKPNPIQSFLNRLGKTLKKLFQIRKPRIPSRPPTSVPQKNPSWKTPGKPSPSSRPTLKESRNQRLARIFRERGYEVFKRGKFKQSLRYFNMALGYYPKDLDSLKMRGLAYLRLKDYLNSFKDFQKASRLQPKNGELYFYQGLCQFYLNQYSKAIPFFSKAIQLNTKDYRSFAYRGYCYLKLKNLNQAEQDFLSAQKLDPKDPVTAYNLGCIYALKGQPQEALLWLKRALKKGYHDFENLKKDPDLKSLHQNPEFQRLLKKRWK
ncbi:MAG: tetratricopeptide repeat protein [Planctomycetota bacterium]|nr:MAG: tetratricopeptide repeat protein [Planctomycetota bacterium]